MKVTVNKIQKSIVENYFSSNEILSYDIDNKYPQNILLICDRSGTATSCVNILADFIYGQGFIKNGDKVVYDKEIKITLDKTMFSAAKDFSYFRGFALHVDYNMNYKIHSVRHVPFEFCRLGKRDDRRYVGKIVYNQDWSNTRPYINSRDENTVIDVFNPDPNVIKYQVEQAGGWQNYNGQILWYSEDGDWVYPRATFDSVLEDVQTDANIKTFKYKNINNRFSASHIFIHKGQFESETEKQEFVKNINEFQGQENAGSIFLVEVDYDEQIPELKPIQQNDNLDKLYAYTEKSIQDNIRKQAKVPPVLIGDLVAGRLGTTEEILDATILFNAFTLSKRKAISDVFSYVMKHFKRPIKAMLEIEPISIIDEHALAKKQKLTLAGGNQSTINNSDKKTDTKSTEE